MTPPSSPAPRAPSRELDAEIAERVMGWTRSADWSDEPCLVSPQGIPVWLDGRGGFSIPRYSEEIADAWQIARMAYRARAYFALALTADSTWVCTIGAYPSVEADTAPLAICLAALASPAALELLCPPPRAPLEGE